MPYVHVYHVEVHWLTADSHVVDDFVNQLFRRAAQWGLRMVQIPEFFCTENLQVHPYRAQPYLGIPPCPNVPTGQVLSEAAHVHTHTHTQMHTCKHAHTEREMHTQTHAHIAADIP